MAGIDLITQKGREFLILAPSTERLTLGIGSDAAPVDYPNVVAYSQNGSSVEMPLKLTREEEKQRKEACRLALAALGLPTDRPVQSTLARAATDASVDDSETTQGGVVTGDAVYGLGSTERYRVVYPCQIGGLDPNRSVIQLRTDLCHIWSAAIKTRLNLDAAQIKDYGLVLLVPDYYSVGDIEVMLEVGFLDMGFKEAVVHAASTAAAFGQGMSSGCMIQIDDTSTCVSCIDDGVLVADSLYVLPFGGTQITQALHWLLQSAHPAQLSSEQRLCDRPWLTEMRDSTCFLPHEGHETTLEDQIQKLTPVEISYQAEDGIKVLEVALGHAACVAPMGLFFPSLLIPHSTWIEASARTASETFYTDLLSDGAPSGKTKPSVHYVTMPLDRAIVQSISAAEKVEQRRRFYTMMLIVGSCSHIKGLPDMLERCVLSALPSDEVIDTVGVIEPKWPSSTMIWKGGVVLGCLSDQWVKREEWSFEGRPNKFGKREIARSRVYWMYKSELGMM